MSSITLQGVLKGSSKSLAMGAGAGLLVLSLLGGGCAGGRATVATGSPVSEKELAGRKLQAPLEQHLCKIAVYPASKPSWQLQRVQSLSGRGKTFEAALEALCREVEGRRLPAVVDIFFARTPSGWSPNFEVRGTAVRFEDGYTPPPPPDWGSIRAPEMQTNPDVEPPPAGEGGSKTSARHRGRRADRTDLAALRIGRNQG